MIMAFSLSYLILKILTLPCMKEETFELFQVWGNYWIILSMKWYQYASILQLWQQSTSLFFLVYPGVRTKKGKVFRGTSFHEKWWAGANTVAVGIKGRGIDPIFNKPPKDIWEIESKGLTEY